MCWRTGTWSWVAARTLSLMRLIVWLTWASSPTSRRSWSTSRWPIRNQTPRRRRTLRRWWWTLNLENINTDKYVYLSDVCKHKTVVLEPGALTVCLCFQSLYPYFFFAPFRRSCSQLLCLQLWRGWQGATWDVQLWFTLVLLVNLMRESNRRSCLCQKERRGETYYCKDTTYHLFLLKCRTECFWILCGAGRSCWRCCRMASSLLLSSSSTRRRVVTCWPSPWRKWGWVTFFKC